jgi:hypothetical protein
VQAAVITDKDAATRITSINGLWIIAIYSQSTNIPVDRAA